MERSISFPGFGSKGTLFASYDSFLKDTINLLPGPLPNVLKAPLGVERESDEERKKETEKEASSSPNSPHGTSTKNGESHESFSSSSEWSVTSSLMQSRVVSSVVGTLTAAQKASSSLSSPALLGKNQERDTAPCPASPSLPPSSSSSSLATVTSHLNNLIGPQGESILNLLNNVVHQRKISFHAPPSSSSMEERETETSSTSVSPSRSLSSPAPATSESPLLLQLLHNVMPQRQASAPAILSPAKEKKLDKEEVVSAREEEEERERVFLSKKQAERAAQVPALLQLLNKIVKKDTREREKEEGERKEKQELLVSYVVGTIMDISQMSVPEAMDRLFHSRAQRTSLVAPAGERSSLSASLPTSESGETAEEEGERERLSCVEVDEEKMIVDEDFIVGLTEYLRESELLHVPPPLSEEEETVQEEGEKPQESLSVSPDPAASEHGEDIDGDTSSAREEKDEKQEIRDEKSSSASPPTLSAAERREAKRKDPQGVHVQLPEAARFLLNDWVKKVSRGRVGELLTEEAVESVEDRLDNLLQVYETVQNLPTNAKQYLHHMILSPLPPLPPLSLPLSDKVIRLGKFGLWGAGSQTPVASPRAFLSPRLSSTLSHAGERGSDPSISFEPVDESYLQAVGEGVVLEYKEGRSLLPNFLLHRLRSMMHYSVTTRAFSVTVLFSEDSSFWETHRPGMITPGSVPATPGLRSWYAKRVDGYTSVVLTEAASRLEALVQQKKKKERQTGSGVGENFRMGATEILVS